MNFNVNEIFFSIQGEGTRAGRKCTFIRFQGCLLRCSWCDTPYALERKEKHKSMSENDLLIEIEKNKNKLIMLTGGEPLEQKDIFEFIDLLCSKNFEVTIETNGQADISKVNKNAILIYDIKCPGSKMDKKNNFNNLKHLSEKDEIKFVIKDENDFNWAVNLCKEKKLFSITNNIIFSPVMHDMSPLKLANLLLSPELSDMDIRMQLQMHKYIWDPEKRGV